MVLSKLLNIADKLSQQRKDKFISSEVVLLAMLDDRGSCGDLLRGAKLTRGALEQAIASVRGGESVDDPRECSGHAGE